MIFALIIFASTSFRKSITWIQHYIREMSSLYLFIIVIDNGQFTPGLAVITFLFRTGDRGSTAELAVVTFGFVTGAQQKCGIIFIFDAL